MADERAWALLRPAIALMRRFRLGAKFVVIAAVLVVPLVVSVSGHVQEVRNDLATLSAETNGARVVIAADRVLLAVVRDGDRVLDGKLGRRREVYTAIVPVAINRARLEGELYSAWNLAERHLAVLRYGQPGDPRRLRDVRESLDGLVALVSAAGSQSELVLDGEASTYYLQLALTARLPQLLTAAHEIEALVEVMLSGARPLDQVTLATTAGKLADLAAKLAHEVRLTALSGQLAPAAVDRLTALVEEFSDRVDQVGAAVRASAARPVKGARVRELRAGADTTPVLRSAGNLLDAVDDVLIGELEQRRAATERELLWSLGLTTGSLALATYLFVGLFAASRQGLRRLQGQLAHVAAGTSPPHIRVTARDEFGMLEGTVLRAGRRLDALVAQLRRQAVTDPLTQLPNRVSLWQRLAQVCAEAALEQPAGAVCMVDLNGFKAVNDRLGHPAGDRLLRGVAHALRRAVWPDEMVARLGGDEFAVVLLGVGDGQQALQRAKALRDVLAEQVGNPGPDVAVTASVGVTLAYGGEAVEDLVHRADVAMYAAKNEPGRVVLWGAGMVAPTAAHREREELAALLADPKGLAIVTQPIVALVGGTVVGYEALARFPGREHRRTDDWFALAAHLGQSPALEGLAVRAALALPGRPPGRYLAVNASPTVLTSSAFLANLPEDLTGIVIEVTEHVDLRWADLEATVAELRRRGARIAVDDTGSGYAGLQRLMALGPDIIKLDRGLVRDVDTSPGKAALVEALVGFARRVDATICAEGVETLGELSALANLDVDVAQGHALARAGPDWPGVDQAVQPVLQPVTVRELPPNATVGAVRSDMAHFVTAVEELSLVAGVEDLSSALVATRRLLRADAVAFSVIEGGDLVVLCSTEPVTPGARFELAEYPATVAILASRQSTQVRADDEHADPAERRVLRELGFQALLMVPVHNAETAVGLLEVYAGGPKTWTRSDVGAAQAVAGQLASVLQRLGLAALPVGLPSQRAGDADPTLSDRR